MALKDWSTTPGSNTGILTGITLDGAVMNVPMVDDAFREMSSQLAQQIGKMNYQGASMASAATLNLATATGWSIDVSGTTTITALGTVAAGQMFILRFTGALTLTHNATTLILPGNANLTVAPGDIVFMLSLGGGAWRCINYQTAAGGATFASNIEMSAASASLTSNTSDGADSKRINIAGGGIPDDTRGGYISLFGNEHATNPGDVLLGRGGGGGIVGQSPTISWGIAGTSAVHQKNDATSLQVFSGGTSATAGAALYVFGQSHATNANDFQIRASNILKYGFDNSIGLHSFIGNGSVTGSFTATGNIEHGAYHADGDTVGALITNDGNVASVRTSADVTTPVFHHLFINRNGTVGTISTNLSATAFNTTSDMRLKENFNAIESGAILDQIEAYRFDWKTGGGGFGVKAQECAEVFPEAVTAGRGEPGQPDFLPWSTDYSRFVPLLLAEIKALRARVAALEA